MNLFRRGGSTALSPASIFVGIGANAPAAAAAAAVPAPAAKKADDDDMKNGKKGDGTKENDPLGAKEPETVPEGSAARESDDDDEDCDCEGDDESDDEDTKKGKKGKKNAIGAARSREKTRIAAILGHPEASGRADFAASLALNTDLPRSQAIALLKTAAKDGKSGLTTAMAGLANAAPGPNSSPEAGTQRHLEANWDRAFEKHAISKK